MCQAGDFSIDLLQTTKAASINKQVISNYQTRHHYGMLLAIRSRYSFFQSQRLQSIYENSRNHTRYYHRITRYIHLYYIHLQEENHRQN
ncbi:hypothetical protein GWI33_012563 [Rhynchophorus ferrugineus]|uniref:Uncharacterized protein n=1 Tax=Rhynchophorus ferrugineus TaxID=354439 RepID=A0A834M8N2_RHYFE|nr:hypothetical protein GWI33_012563 [Rhynchophorus ferrugineus]